ncbi:sensor histidine kinase [Leifsonia xyli]|uniref:sensor histidine kinase n=1 Tax=Leifsonia xyli TaxID=1575 RepID=UPI000A898921
MTTLFAIVALGLHLGFSVGGVVGPLIAAGVAVLIGLAYRALRREARERELLLAELLRTRQQLAETEREQGALSERARLAREIHDTVAQGLASIQMLLRAAERDTPEPGAGYLRLARETAADSLADTRQIIRELTPARLDGGLGAALRRLGREHADRSAIPVEVRADDLELPMDTQTALLRIAQGALSNAVLHADASHVAIELREDGDTVSLVVRDDGRGFDVEAALAGIHGSDSFGLQAMQERIDQLDGTLEIVSAPGTGTTVTARLPLARAEGMRP